MIKKYIYLYTHYYTIYIPPCSIITAHQIHRNKKHTHRERKNIDKSPKENRVSYRIYVQTHPLSFIKFIYKIKFCRMKQHQIANNFTSILIPLHFFLYEKQGLLICILIICDTYVVQLVEVNQVIIAGLVNFFFFFFMLFFGELMSIRFYTPLILEGEIINKNINT